MNGKTTTKATELTKETTIESSEDSDNELSEVHFEMKDSSDEETVSDTEMISMKREKGETVDRIKAQMLHYFGGKHNYERWVFKCTSKVPEPPHINYLRKIILEAWECKSINFFYKELIKYILNGFCDWPRRPLFDSEIVAVKALTSVLRIHQLGTDELLEGSMDKIDIFEEMANKWCIIEVFDRLCAVMNVGWCQIE